MKITDILVQDAVILDLASASKPDALRELATALAEAEPELETEPLLTVLTEREGAPEHGHR